MNPIALPHVGYHAEFGCSSLLGQIVWAYFGCWCHTLSPLSCGGMFECRNMLSCVTMLNLPKSAGATPVWVMDMTAPSINLFSPMWVSMPNLVAIGQTRIRDTRIRRKIDPRVPPFKVTQGHRKCHGSIGYI